MTLTSFDDVFFTVAFLVPGFVWESVLHMFLRRREDRADRAWVRFLTLSAINYGLWSWLIYLLLERVGLLAREQLYKVEDDGPWQPAPMNRGVWIRGEAIRAIEFFEFQ